MRLQRSPFWWGTSWAVPDLANSLPHLESQGVLFGVIGLIALLFFGRRSSPGIVDLRGVRVAAAAVMFFGIPIVASEYARGSVPSTTRSALFAMVPVVVVMVVAAGDESGGKERGAMRFLVPSLVGIGGLLLLLPMQFSGSVRGRSCWRLSVRR